MKIKVGSRVKDRLTGITGTAIARTERIWDERVRVERKTHVEVVVQPDSDGPPASALTFNEDRLDTVQRNDE